MESRKIVIGNLIKKNIKKNINDVYWEIHEKLELDSNYDDIVELYKNEIHNRMKLYFKKKIKHLDLSINFENFYDEMINKDKFKYKIDLSKNLQKAYETEVNSCCFKKYNYKKKLYNLYNVLSIDELNKLNN